MWLYQYWMVIPWLCMYRCWLCYGYTNAGCAMVIPMLDGYTMVMHVQMFGYTMVIPMLDGCAMVIPRLYMYQCWLFIPMCVLLVIPILVITNVGVLNESVKLSA